MASEVKLYRSLPPLVEGKVHGCLKLVIDEVVWSRKSPGEVTVLASWWGEFDSAQFRPVDIKTDITRPSEDITEIYSIKTNVVLFKEYLKNCETIQLVVYSEDTHQVIGTAQVGDLLQILENKPYFRYVPILNSCGNKIGDLHIAIKLLTMTRDLHSQSKIHKLQEKRLADKDTLSKLNIDEKYNAEELDESQTSNDSDQNHLLPMKLSKYDKYELGNSYKSVIKAKKKKHGDPFKRFDPEITDKLVAQVVARAQRLRGAILKETSKDDLLALSDNSGSDGICSDMSLNNEAKLYEYFLGKEMSRVDEKRALNTLRSVSPTQSLIDLASNTISSCQHNNVLNKEPTCPEALEMHSFKDSSCRDNQLLNRVDSIRVFIESFTLNSAGFRRVKSSSTLRNESATKPVTYFIQYDIPVEFCNGKSTKNKKPTKIYSKKQMDQTIYFNYEAIHNISKFNMNTDSALKFKILHRHLNQRLPSELGTGILFVKDIASTSNLSSTQRVAIINKGIKTGELKVTVELGCDCVHFGKQYVDALMSAKENIPLLETSSLTNTATDKYRNVTGTHSKSNSRVSSASAKRIDCLSSNTNYNIVTAKNVLEQQQTASDNSQVDVQNPDKENKNKVLLHGLIYVAEGHDLPELNTYLICRAFWPEDKAASKICNNTRNPVYNFCQQVPLIHGTDLLERVKNNYVIIEVYSKNNSGGDSLLGIAKLSLHQLYIAYRDPLVLPHLLLSQYPVISVDGWVPISDPVTGQSCGQLLALVALGTAEQIARLEITRGLRDTTMLPPSVSTALHKNNHTNFSHNIESQEAKDDKWNIHQNVQQTRQDNGVVVQTSKLYDVRANADSVKSQECQTDISTLRETKTDDVVNEITRENALSSDSSVLHALVDRLAQALNVPKTHTSQSAQTETDAVENRKTHTEDTEHTNRFSLHSLSDDSEIGSPRNNFQMPAELYRSVGVGAEYDDAVDQVASTSYSNPVCESPGEDIDDEQPDTIYEDSFRALIEIECALHLPKMEKLNETVEPSTYVTFQRNSQSGINHFNSYMITNVYPHSCDPKWDWRCETRLPAELLLNDTKRLILKVWRLFDPDVNLEVDLENDIVLGFSSIDLSVLLTGFPIVSGWFHIIDFTGRCNGQLKVNITPMENLSSIARSTVTSALRMPESNSSQSSWSPTYSQAVLNNLETNQELQSTHPHQSENEPNENENESNNPADFCHGFENVSMSFLSHSLKQKLTELDEITKRLQSRLRDVTNTAFEDDFDNDFDLNEPPNDIENNDNINAGAMFSRTMVDSSKDTEHSSLTNKKFSVNRNMTNIENQRQQIINDTPNQRSADSSNYSKMYSYKTSDTGYSTYSNLYSNQKLSNEHPPEDYTSLNDNSSENSADYPVRGTKTHISYLLDKLTLQFPTKTMSSTNLSTASSPMRKNVIDLLSSLRLNNNQPYIAPRCTQKREVRTVLTQTESDDDIEDNLVPTRQEADTVLERNGSNDENKNISARSKISDVIRDELIADDNNDSIRCDELSSYLITSNVRHMEGNDFFNPLLYQHLVPNVPVSTNVSPEGEAVEQLDNRYAKTFNSALYSKYSGIRRLQGGRNVSVNESSTQTMSLPGTIESFDNTVHLRLTPSGVSENIDGNIDLTVIHKSSNQDLMDGNSTESTTTMTFDKSSQVNPDMELEEMEETSCSISSGSLVSTVSRQAPDGGNPTEELPKPVITTGTNDSEESSSTS